MDQITWIAAATIYVMLILIALWGVFCVAMAWMRVTRQQFRSEKEQDEFLTELEEPLRRGDYEAAESLCAKNPRALPQLAHMGIQHRASGYGKVRQLVVDRFERDVLSDLEQRLTWINTVIKSAPMMGLLGTVIGMMGAFAKLRAGDSADPVALAGDISVALITTACGLTIAIPLVLCTAVIQTRIRRMEDLVSVGLARFLELFSRGP